MELRGERHGWGPVRRDSDFAKEQRRQNALLREEYQTPEGTLDRRGERGPLGQKHDVGDGKSMSVAEIGAATGLQRGAIYGRLARGLRGRQLLALHHRTYYRDPEPVPA